MMRMARRAVGVTAVVLLVTATASTASASTDAASTPACTWLSGHGHYLHRGGRGEADVNLCSVAVSVGVAHCDAHVRTDDFGKGLRPLRRVPSAPGSAVDHTVLGNDGAYDPAFLQSAYKTPSTTGGTGQTVAVVDAFDAPNIESDLAEYRSMFGLRVHDRERLLHEGRRERRHQLPGSQLRLGR